MRRRRRRRPFAPWIPVLLITSGRSTVHHPSTLIDPGRFPNWKVDARPHLRSIYYSTFLSAGCVHACVTHVRVAERSTSFSFVSAKRGMKNCWKFWQRARSAYPFVLQTTLNKGGLILEWPPKKFSVPTHIHTQTRTYVRVRVLSRRSLL